MKEEIEKLIKKTQARIDSINQTLEEKKGDQNALNIYTSKRVMCNVFIADLEGLLKVCDK